MSPDIVTQQSRRQIGRLSESPLPFLIILWDLLLCLSKSSKETHIQNNNNGTGNPARRNRQPHIYSAGAGDAGFVAPGRLSLKLRPRHADGRPSARLNVSRQQFGRSQRRGRAKAEATDKGADLGIFRQLVGVAQRDCQ